MDKVLQYIKSELVNDALLVTKIGGEYIYIEPDEKAKDAGDRYGRVILKGRTYKDIVSPVLNVAFDVFIYAQKGSNDNIKSGSYIDYLVGIVRNRLIGLRIQQEGISSITEVSVYEEFGELEYDNQLDIFYKKGVYGVVIMK